MPKHSTVSTKLLIQKLQATLGSMGHDIEAIKTILNVNHVRIYDGISITPQTRGVLQGDSMSPLNLMTADVTQILNGMDANLIMYSDDMVILSKNQVTLQSTFSNLKQWTESNALKINNAKTKVMTFRKGGKLCANDFSCHNASLEILVFEISGNHTADYRINLHPIHQGKGSSSNQS
ncbi:hypothetical protein ANN_22729 [Periplaneta americana]|uniref:Reverse transcriptase domain-containing protein n=1 Tax=Periplaneta americana TaxID=6978 RepID=A0ABQ8SKE7_PERAM|nr:hypothetical protein ANN_22729 [Periplaneta americana]